MSITSSSAAANSSTKPANWDLEGVVAKRKDSRYQETEKRSPHWIKIKNRNYSQAEGREELFERA